MKYLIYIYAVIFSLNSIAQKSNSITVKGNIKELDDQFILLYKINKSMDNIFVDSVFVKKGKFKFSFNKPELELYSLNINDPMVDINKSTITLIIDKNTRKIKVKGNKQTISEKAKIKGSKNSQNLLNYSNFLISLYNKKNNILKSDKENTIKQKMLDSLKKIEYNYALNQINKNPASLTSFIELFSIYNKSNNYNNMDTNLVLYNKVMEAIKLKYPNSFYNNIIKARKDKLISEIKIAKTNETAVNVANNKTIKLNEIVPDIIAKNPDGQTIKLSDLRGEIVLIDFWASWCGPCRRENPNVVKEYQKYKNKGFTVFSVSLDQKSDAWKKAIIQDNLSWPYHVSDLKGWSSTIAKLYNVNSIPKSFLIDENGKLIAVNLRGKLLEQKLIEVFEK